MAIKYGNKAFFSFLYKPGAINFHICTSITGLEIKNAADGSVKILTEKIPALSLLDSKTRNGNPILHLEYPNDKDPREELFQYAIDSKWVVTEMSPHSVDLESIFRKLTMEDGANA